MFFSLFCFKVKHQQIRHSCLVYPFRALPSLPLRPLAKPQKCKATEYVTLLSIEQRYNPATASWNVMSFYLVCFF